MFALFEYIFKMSVLCFVIITMVSRMHSEV